jgi:hypothetical protein
LVDELHNLPPEEAAVLALLEQRLQQAKPAETKPARSHRRAA